MELGWPFPEGKKATAARIHSAPKEFMARVCLSRALRHLEPVMVELAQPEHARQAILLSRVRLLAAAAVVVVAVRALDQLRGRMAVRAAL